MVSANDKKIFQTHCPTCDGDRSCTIHASVDKNWDWSDGHGHHVNGAVKHSLLECNGCNTVFYETNSWDSEDYDHYIDADGSSAIRPNLKKSTFPKPTSRNRPKWLNEIASVDPQLSNILDEMYLAYDTESYILTAIGLRTALDRSTEILGIDPTLTFNDKLNSLQKGGWIGATEKETLDAVTDAGNAAAHRAWQPSSTDASQLLTALEIFLQKSFILGNRALEVKNNIPQKSKRSK